MSVIRPLAFVTSMLALVGTPGSAYGSSDPPAPPTLARLAIYLPPERIAGFEPAFEAKLVPILRTHGFREGPPSDRAMPDSIFSRLFEIEDRAALAEMREAVEADPLWDDALQVLGTTYGATGSGSRLRAVLQLYSTGGQGRTIPAGPGKGNWKTYDITDGIGGGKVWGITQDRDGYMWFATAGGGVSLI